MPQIKLQNDQVQNREAFIKGFKSGVEISVVTLLIVNTILIKPAFGSQQRQQDSSKISHSKLKIVSLALWTKAVLKKKAYVLGLIVGVLCSWLAVRKIKRYWYCLKKFLSFCYYLLYPHYYIPGEDFTEYLELPSP